MSLLKPHEPAAFLLERPEAQSPFVLTCDHASQRIPEALGDLGVSAAERERHIAWDIGALAVARGLMHALDATLISTGYSRLVIDANRPPGRFDAVPETSEATEIPGNRGLPQAAIEMRQRALFDPYHAAISGLLDARLAAGRPAIFIAIHSFTPVYLGQSRPWQVALLSHRDRRLTDWMLAALRQDPNLCVGDNTPYRVTDEGDYGIPVHAERRGLPHLLIELRQDLIAEPAGQGVWIERLASLLKIAPRFQP